MFASRELMFYCLSFDPGTDGGGPKPRTSHSDPDGRELAFENAAARPNFRYFDPTGRETLHAA